jgi:GxxExxY protein
LRLLLRLFTAEKGGNRGFAGNMDKHELNRIGGIILNAAITVHKELGPGLLESAYVISLARELSLKNLQTRTQVPVELKYKGVELGKVYVIDLLVENEIIIEVKSVDAINPIFVAQLITYLKISGKHLGYLINFNILLLKNGFKRIVYQF